MEFEADCRGLTKAPRGKSRRSLEPDRLHQAVGLFLIAAVKDDSRKADSTGHRRHHGHGFWTLRSVVAIR